jgi:hypothetical protein
MISPDSKSFALKVPSVKLKACGIRPHQHIHGLGNKRISWLLLVGFREMKHYRPQNKLPPRTR